MSIIKKTRENKYWWGCGAKGALVHRWWCKLGRALLENSVEVSQKIKSRLPYDPAVPLRSIYPKEMKWNHSLEELIYTPKVIAILSTIAQDMVTTKVSTDGWMHKENIVCIYIYVYPATSVCMWINGILFSHKKKEILPFRATWMNMESLILSEVSHRKDKKK